MSTALRHSQKILLILSVLSFVASAAGSASAETVQFQGGVVVEADGNAFASASFPTTLGGEEVRYLMVVENGCRLRRSGRGCGRPSAPSVGSLSITLNGEVVFEPSGAFEVERVEVALNPQGGSANEILIQAQGSQGAAARVILVGQSDVSLRSGRSTLPWAESATLLFLHNTGPNPLAYRLTFFRPDGSISGRSDARRLDGRAAERGELGVLAGALGFDWTTGAVHVNWAAAGAAALDAAASDAAGSPALSLDDEGPFPISPQALDELSGGVLGEG